VAQDSFVYFTKQRSKFWNMFCELFLCTFQCGILVSLSCATWHN